MTLQSSHESRRFNPFTQEQPKSLSSGKQISRNPSRKNQSSGNRLIQTSSGKETSFFRNETESERLPPAIIQPNSRSSQKGPEAPRDLLQEHYNVMQPLPLAFELNEPQSFGRMDENLNLYSEPPLSSGLQDRYERQEPTQPNSRLI